MLFYLQQCIKRCIPNTLKNIVRHNRFYTEYILPWRLNYQQKKVAKLDDETFLTMRQSIYLVIFLILRIHKHLMKK